MQIEKYLPLILEILELKSNLSSENYEIQGIEGELEGDKYFIYIELHKFSCKIEHLSLKLKNGEKYTPSPTELEFLEERIWEHFFPKQA